MTLLEAHVVCAALTWIALVSDGVVSLTPRQFVRALRSDIQTFGFLRVGLWALICLTCWWVVWFAWLADEWIDRRR